MRLICMYIQLVELFVVVSCTGTPKICLIIVSVVGKRAMGTPRGFLPLDPKTSLIAIC